VSIPPDPPSNQPDQPDQPDRPQTRSKDTKPAGAIAATAAVVLVSCLTGISRPVNGFIVAPVVALTCVVLGSVLTIFEPVRRFAVGFLIASAVLIFVTAGVCVVAISSSLGTT
jgi:hypothetical protein